MAAGRLEDSHRDPGNANTGMPQILCLQRWSSASSATVLQFIFRFTDCHAEVSISVCLIILKMTYYMFFCNYLPAAFC